MMIQSAITAYFHYLGFMVAFGALAIEAYTIKKDLTLEEAWRLVIADSVYGISMTIVLITGILRVMYFGKGTDYYLGNHIFYTKIAIFSLVGLFSLYPTFSFIAWIKTLRDRQVPDLELSQVQKLSRLIRGELVGLALIPLFAALLARGF
ncbi:MAG: DUF2214 family protein [Merismopediaceae bacterium]|nr:DUF2214 family protein [Merismopediaceae bacterium]